MTTNMYELPELEQLIQTLAQAGVEDKLLDQVKAVYKQARRYSVLRFLDFQLGHEDDLSASSADANAYFGAMLDERVDAQDARLQESLALARKQAKALGDFVLQGHDFGHGAEVISQKPWNLPETGNEMACLIVVKGGMFECPTTLNFIVTFDSSELVVTYATALDNNGTEFGRSKLSFPVESVVFSDTVNVENSGDQSVDFEVLPGSTTSEIDHVLMQDVVGDYDDPEDVPEWKWVEDNASYAHCQNGKFGIWEFVINLAGNFETIPASLQQVIAQARAKHLSYLIIHQGT